jgi:membrane protein YqaA with SNARE-associated domain
VTQQILDSLGIYAGIFIIGIISGLVPFLPAEIILGAVVVLAGNLWLAVSLGVLVAAGQMVAKALLYKGAQRAVAIGGEPKEGSKLARAKKYVDRWKDKPLLLTFVSGTIGIPPLLLIAPLAGIMGIRFRAFLACGMAGRTVRFVTIAVIALYASH